MMRLPTKAGGTIGILVLVALLSSVAVMSGFTVYSYDNSQLTPVQTTTTHLVDNYVNNLFDQVNVSLNLKVLNPDRAVVRNVTYPNDIITNNLITFAGDFWSGNNCPSLVPITGGSFGSCGNQGESPFVAEYYGSVNTAFVGGDGGYIGIGTGTSAVSRTDHALQTQVGSWQPITGPIVSGNSIIVAAGITLTSAATVSEAGYAEQLGANYQSSFVVAKTSQMALFFHDTFTGIAVAVDQTIQIQYTLTLPSGANENIVAFFASMMQSVSQTATATNVGPMEDSAGTTFASGSFAWWVSDTSSGTSAFISVAASPTIEVGTSLTAPTSTDHVLGAQVGPTNSAVTLTLDMTNSRFLDANTILLSSSYTIQEAGFFYGGEWSGSGGNQGGVQFLLFHSLTGAVSVPVNNAITTQFTVQF
ncbi:MAG: hypothetical protein JRN15_17060 [Nitrososphaerota archaeon]|nr:hypothetical protein [Nitrososphaerota archaeon]